MSISLAKGQAIRLAKSPDADLVSVRMGLGWDAIKKRGFFGIKAQSIDLDASAILYDAAGSIVDQVWFRQLTSRDGAVQHTGDNRTGAGDGDDESIKVDLSRLPQNVATIVFLVNSFTGQNFSQIQNAYCRLIDESNEQELARYDLTGSGNHTAQIMTKISRTGGSWSMTAIGAPASGRTFADLLPVITPYL